MASPTEILVDKATIWAESIEGEFAKLANQEAEHENFRERFQIFRVPDNWKKLHKDVFDPDFLSLGLFSELDCTHISETPTQFKLVVVNGIIEHVNTKQTKALDRGALHEKSSGLDWKALRDSVVRDPRAMQRYYDLDETQHTEDTVRSVLALDSVFLCGYLHAYLLKKSYPQSLYANIVDQRSISFHQKLVNDIVKLENQVPLVLIQRGLAIITSGRPIPVIERSEANQEIEENVNVASRVKDIKLNDKDLRKELKGPKNFNHHTSGLHQICNEWVLLHSESLPGFDRIDPNFLRRSPWQMQFEECKHLLGCLCRVMERRPGEMTFPRGFDLRREMNDWERQLNYFVRKKIESSPSFKRQLSLIRRFFRKLFWGLRRLQQIISRRKFHPEGPEPDLTPIPKEISLPTASKLRQRGIHFRGMTYDTGNVVPIFERGRLRNLSAVLYIPTFSVLQNTELVWRNMLAYILDCNASERDWKKRNKTGEVQADWESLPLLWRRKRLIEEMEDELEFVTREREFKQLLNEVRNRSHAHNTKLAAADFVWFMMFMDEMIDTEQDVALLRYGKHRVIKKSLLGSNKEVANLFNTIARQQTMASIEYGEDWQRLRHQIEEFVSEERRVLLLEFLRYFFGKPWLFPSVLAASVLLCLALLQTVYTILSYYFR